MDPDLDVRPAPGGCRLRLRVKPSARADAVLGVHGGALKVSVAAPAERGKANAAVVALLAEALRVPAGSVAITSGEASQDKTVVVSGLDPREALRRLSFPPRRR